MGKTIWLANPRGFCAGVERAIEIVELLLERHGSPIYVKHEIVHNKRVIRQLSEKGAKFIEDPKMVPVGSILVFSAHGVSQAVRVAAKEQGVVVHDATCPLVTKVHAEVVRMRVAGKEILMLGHRGHPEVEGTMGQVPDGIQLVEDTDDARMVQVADPDQLAYVTQTTLSVTETREIIATLRDRFPSIQAPAKNDICYATQNRQDAVRALAAACDLVLVVGSPNSSNSNRLCEEARQCGVQAHLLDSAADIQPGWLAGCQGIGVTAGASAPEEVLQEVVAFLRDKLPNVPVIELDGEAETIHFSVPKGLRKRNDEQVGKPT